MSDQGQFEVRDSTVAGEVAPRRDFYLGTEARVPRGLRIHLKVIYTSLLLLAGAVAFVLAVAQNPAPDSHYGATREFEGIVTLRPYPSLLLGNTGPRGNPPTATPAAARGRMAGRCS